MNYWIEQEVTLAPNTSDEMRKHVLTEAVAALMRNPAISDSGIAHDAATATFTCVVDGEKDYAMRTALIAFLRAIDATSDPMMFCDGFEPKVTALDR